MEPFLFAHPGVEFSASVLMQSGAIFFPMYITNGYILMGLLAPVGFPSLMHAVIAQLGFPIPVARVCMRRCSLRRL
jgi:hypothetical protein